MSETDKKYYLRNIHLSGNEHGQLKRDVIYASLYDDEGNIIISATLKYILCQIRDLDLNVYGVTAERRLIRGKECSFVSLDLYK